MIDKNVVDLMCKELVELVSDYLGDTLDATERMRFERHLLTCPPCTTYLEQMRTTIELAGELDEVPTTADVERELVDLFRRWHRK